MTGRGADGGLAMRIDGHPFVSRCRRATGLAMRVNRHPLFRRRAVRAALAQQPVPEAPQLVDEHCEDAAVVAEAGGSVERQGAEREGGEEDGGGENEGEEARIAGRHEEISFKGVSCTGFNADEEPL